MGVISLFIYCVLRGSMFLCSRRIGCSALGLEQSSSCSRTAVVPFCLPFSNGRNYLHMFEQT